MTSPWVQRALRHEIMAQPRGETFASRYTGVTRNAEADDLPRVMTREERLAQTGDCPSLYPDTCPDVNTCPVHDDGTLFPDDPDPTLDPAYPPPNEAERAMYEQAVRGEEDAAAWFATIPPTPDEELPFDGAYYSDGTRI